MDKAANYQDLLKTLALVAMMIDHLGLYFFPDIHELRIIGRYAMPLFGFFAGYNFKNQINLTILFVGSVLYIISTVFIFHTLMETNILISIFIGHVYIYLFREHLKNFNKAYIHFVILACLWPLTSKYIDYGTVIIAIMVIGYVTKSKIINIRLSSFVVAFLSAIHSYANFDGYFTNIDMCLVILVAAFIFITLNRANFETNIPVNIKIISRHTLFFYSIQLILIEFIWRYHIL